MENTISESIPVGANTESAEAAYLSGEAAMEASPNRLANLWLLLLSGILGLTLLCTGALVAWPVLSWLATKVTEM
nr:hypothetical protein [Desulfuromonadales bacterium]